MAAPIIPSGGASMEDRRPLRTLQSALSERGSLRYLEVGCYLGSTLESFVTDPACEAITAIDRRDATSPNVRGAVPYPDNATARMLELPGAVPGADLDRLHAVPLALELTGAMRARGARSAA
jgi:hypothetical protein